MLRRRLLALLTLVALTAAGCTSTPGSGDSGPYDFPSTGGDSVSFEPTDSPTPTAHPTTHAPTPRQVRAKAFAAVARIVEQEPAGGVSVAALNTTTGARFTAGATSGMWTASTYKLLCLLTLMLRSGGTGGYDSTAAAAIENSDNVAGYSLWEAAGGNPGMEQLLARIGATHTVPGGSDPTFTRTSASDYLKALQTLVGGSTFSATQRAYVLNLMHNVEADQRWGVGVTADKGTTFANKNGWLSIDDSNGPGETDGGLWAVNSVGIVRIGGQQVLMAVFTEHQPDMATGVRLVQKLARTIAPAVS